MHWKNEKIQKDVFEKSRQKHENNINAPKVKRNRQMCQFF